MTARTAHEMLFWSPEPLLAGETVFLLAGGASLRDFDWSCLAGRRTIAINESAKRVPVQDILYFTDNGWFERNRDLVAGWAGPVISVSRAAKRALPQVVRRVQMEHRPDFPPPGAGIVRWGRSSGHIAVSVAVALGARRNVLLGYDMHEDGGRSHWHDAYANRDPNLYAGEFAPAFAGWHEAARRAGVEIVNATPGSALREFPMVALADELAPRTEAA